MSIENVPEPIYNQPFALTCRATLNPKIASQLIQYMVMEWIGSDGKPLTNDSNMTAVYQKTFYSEAIQILVFNGLSMSHGGSYTCRAKIVFPDLGILFSTSSEYHLNVLSKYIVYILNEIYKYTATKNIIIIITFF